MGERGKVAQLDLVVACDAVSFADRSHHFGLLDGVDAEVSLKVEIEIEHVDGIARLLSDQGEDFFLDRIASFIWLRRCRRRGQHGLRFDLHSALYFCLGLGLGFDLHYFDLRYRLRFEVWFDDCGWRQWWRRRDRRSGRLR